MSAIHVRLGAWRKIARARSKIESHSLEERTGHKPAAEVFDVLHQLSRVKNVQYLVQQKNLLS
jgi:hypothetical protein